MEQIRRIDLVFSGEEAKDFDRFRQRCEARGIGVARGLKEFLPKSGK
jgi:hypothetical protein